MDLPVTYRDVLSTQVALLKPSVRGQLLIDEKLRIYVPKLDGSGFTPADEETDVSTLQTLVAALNIAVAAKLDSAAVGTSVAPLSGGTVPSAYLPSYVDDVLEYATVASLPAVGETGKIYVITNDGSNTNNEYRWTGTQYTQLSKSPGTTDAVPEGTINKYFTDARAQAALSSLLALKLDASAVGSSVASLVGGKVPTGQLPVGAQKAWNIVGTWDANANTTSTSISLASGVGTEGQGFLVAGAGTTSLDGFNSWANNDIAIFFLGAWRRIPAAFTGLTSRLNADGSTDILNGSTVVLNTFSNMARVTPIPDLTLSTSLQQLLFPIVQVRATLTAGSATTIQLKDQNDNDFGTFVLDTLNETKASPYLLIATGNGAQAGQLKYVVLSGTGTVSVVATTAFATQNVNAMNLVTMGGTLAHSISSVATDWACISMFVQALQQLGWRLEFQTDLSSGNVLASDILNTQLPALKALSPMPGWVWLTLPVFDYISGVGTTATVIPVVKQVIDGILATGAKLAVFSTTTGTAGSYAATQINIQNSWASTYVNSKTNAYFVDVGSRLEDPATGQCASAYVGTDTTTLNLNGALLAGKIAFDVLDPVIPRKSVSSSSWDNRMQLVGNPRLVATTGGGNASGSNGWSAGTGTSGVGPDNYSLTRSGSATAVATYVSRESAVYAPRGAGNVLSLALTGGASGDKVTLAPAQPTIINWSSGASVPKGQRMRASFGSAACNVVQYLCVTAGTLATGSDPTSAGNYINTAVGNTFTDGTVTWLVVPSIDGDRGLKPWSSLGVFATNMRIKPTTPNGYHYKVKVGGTLASSTDPTGSWSTTLGATFTDGTVTLQVIAAYDNGDSVYFQFEAYGAFSSAGLAGAPSLVLAQYTLGYGYLGGAGGNNFSSGTMPLKWYDGVWRTRAQKLDCSVDRFVPSVDIPMAASASGVIEVVRCEVRKVGT